MRWRGVGGWGATATLLRTIEVGAVSVGIKQGSLSLQLVPGVATPRHARPSVPLVERGHVDGLSCIDRQLLILLFDEMAHAPSTDIASLAGYRRTHPLEFWNRLREWRAAVDADATRLKTGGRLPVTRKVIDDARGELVDRLLDASLSTSEWSQCAGIAIVAGLDDVVVRSAHGRRKDHPEGRIAGPSGVVWVSCLQSGRRSGIDTLRRLFSPLRPSSYPPAQYTKIVLPPWHGRPRFVDDGSQRIGG